MDPGKPATCRLMAASATVTVGVAPGPLSQVPAFVPDASEPVLGHDQPGRRLSRL
jgi:hypothetical protein